MFETPSDRGQLTLQNDKHTAENRCIVICARKWISSSTELPDSVQTHAHSESNIQSDMRPTRI